MAALIEVSDVTSTYPEAASIPDVQIAGLVALASGVARLKAPGLDHRIAMGELDLALVVAVVAGSVARALRNPQGAKTLSQTTGPFSETVTFDERVAAGFVYLTPDEVALLGGPRAGVSSIRSIRLGHT